MNSSRRDFLRKAGLGALAGLSGCTKPLIRAGKGVSRTISPRKEAPPVEGFGKTRFFPYHAYGKIDEKICWVESNGNGWEFPEANYYDLQKTRIRSEDVAPPRPFGKNGKFAVISDTHGHLANEGILEAIDKTDPDFVLHAGDTVNHGNNINEWQQWQRASFPLARKVSFIYAPGNHDKGQWYHQFMHQPGNEKTFLAKKGPITIAVMDTTTQDLKPQIALLEDGLAEDTSEFRILLMHKGCFSGLNSWRKADAKKRLDILAPFIEKQGFNLCCAGHDHFWREDYIEHTPHLTVGCVGKTFRAPFGVTYEGYAWGLVHVEEKRLVYEARKANGTIIKTIEIKN